MGVLRDFVFMGFVLAGALLGSQVPAYVDAYAQRLGGALDEVRTTLASFERAAASADLTFDEYLRRLTASEEPAFRRTGEAVERLVERAARLAALERELAMAGPWTRPLVLIRHHDRMVLERAYEQWRPGLSLDPRWGAIGLALGWLLHAGISALTALAGRRPAIGRRRIR